MAKEIKKYTIVDILEARDDERNRIRIIMEYLLNKSCRQIPLKGEPDYKTLLDDMQDLESSLTD